MTHLRSGSGLPPTRNDVSPWDGGPEDFLRPAGSGTPSRPSVVIRRLERADEQEFIKAAARSFDFHQRWIVAPRNEESFQRYLANFERTDAEAFVVCDEKTSAITGFINVNEIVREPYQRGLLGFGAFVPHAGRGYMSAGLKLICRYAFSELSLHRLEADVQPENLASRTLVARNGFRCEGVSVGFIRLNGVWTDHERWSLVAPD